MFSQDGDQVREAPSTVWTFQRLWLTAFSSQMEDMLHIVNGVPQTTLHNTLSLFSMTFYHPALQVGTSIF
jgi:hypothetical protein